MAGAEAGRGTEHRTRRNNGVLRRRNRDENLDGVITSWNQGAERIFDLAGTRTTRWSTCTMLMPPERIDEEPGIRRSVAVRRSTITQQSIAQGRHATDHLIDRFPDLRRPRQRRQYIEDGGDIALRQAGRRAAAVALEGGGDHPLCPDPDALLQHCSQRSGRPSADLPELSGERRWRWPAAGVVRRHPGGRCCPLGFGETLCGAAALAANPLSWPTSSSPNDPKARHSHSA